MHWLQAHLSITREQAPLIELLFEKLGALSVTLLDAADEPMLEPAPGEIPLWSSTRVTGLFVGSTDSDTLRSAINQALNTEISQRLELDILEDQAWERTWLDHFHPMRFGNKLWICPTGRQVDVKPAVIIRLDPGLAFGTGTHPTTALCLEWLDSAHIQEKTIVDYGCGSGILAIAALKLGAARVIAIDHDPQAIIATDSNAQLNDVHDKLVTIPRAELIPSDIPANSLSHPTQADVVIANILANVLVDLAPKIGTLVKPGGELLLSGILHDQAPQVIAVYNEFSFSAAARQGDWVRLHAHKRKTLK